MVDAFVTAAELDQSLVIGKISASTLGIKWCLAFRLLQHTHQEISLRWATDDRNVTNLNKVSK